MLPINQKLTFVQCLKDYYYRVTSWTAFVFGFEILKSEHERSARLLEEATELAQACGVSKEVCIRIIERTYSRPVGDRRQESAGVFLCLLAWLSSQEQPESRIELLLSDIDDELRRLEHGDPDHFRGKHLAKYEAGTGMKPTR